MLFQLLGFAIFNQFGTDEAKRAAEKGFNQAMIVLAGIIICLIGVAVLISSNKVVAGAVNIVASKGTALVSN